VRYVYISCAKFLSFRTVFVCDKILLILLIAQDFNNGNCDMLWPSLVYYFDNYYSCEH
jgi:hypothetical protein